MSTALAGETVSAISQRNRVSPQAIVEANGLSSSAELMVGSS